LAPYPCTTRNWAC